MEDFSSHTIRACLKEFHNTHQDKFEKGCLPPRVLKLTQILTVKKPMPFRYLEVSDYVECILLGHITVITAATASHCSTRSLFPQASQTAVMGTLQEHVEDHHNVLTESTASLYS